MKRHDGLNRRSITFGGVAVAASVAAPSIVRAQATKIVYATWGGSWEAAMKKAWFGPFTQETGIEVQTVSGNTYGKLQAMVEFKRTEWDVIEGLPELGRVGAQKGLFEPIDFTKIDRTSFLDRPGLVAEFVVPQQLFGRLLVYSKKLAKAPASGRTCSTSQRSLASAHCTTAPRVGPVEAALLADGVAPRQALSARCRSGVQEAFHHSRSHPVLSFAWPSRAVPERRSASMSLLADGRALNIKNAGAQVELEPRVTLLTWSVLRVPKGAPTGCGYGLLSLRHVGQGAGGDRTRVQLQAGVEKGVGADPT